MRKLRLRELGSFPNRPNTGSADYNTPSGLFFDHAELVRPRGRCLAALQTSPFSLPNSRLTTLANKDSAKLRTRGKSRLKTSHTPRPRADARRARIARRISAEAALVQSERGLL